LLRRDRQGFDSHEKMVNALKKLISLLVAIVILGRMAFAPPAFGASASASITQAEAESFVSSFYRDLEGDDLDKVMAHFDQTVEYYTSGPKERAFIANVHRQYLAYYPSRSFSIAAVKLKTLPKPDRVTVNFDLWSFLRNPDRNATMSGHAHVEWDLVKRDGALKITRFTGTTATEPAASPTR
jgi:hypothetical protein